ncbi:MAG TPA: hypothetical protein VIG99_05325 [Myxococcaceae bacterium]|jgi:hypothetical protein
MDFIGKMAGGLLGGGGGGAGGLLGGLLGGGKGGGGIFSTVLGIAGNFICPGLGGMIGGMVGSAIDKNMANKGDDPAKQDAKKQQDTFQQVGGAASTVAQLAGGFL